MPITLTPTAGRRDPDRTARILAACRPGRTDDDVAREVGCGKSAVQKVRRGHGIPAGVGRGKSPYTHPTLWKHRPCPAEWAGLAASLGLSVLVHDPGEQSGVSWHVTRTRGRRFLGSWVPATGSLRAGKVMHAGVTDPAAALRLFAGVPS